MNILTPVRYRTMAEIKEQCRRQRVKFQCGKEVIVVGGKSGWACYMPLTGMFWGRTPNHTMFHSTTRQFDRKPWMQQLRAFFHQEVTR